MRQSGKIAARVLRAAAGFVAPGMTTAELDVFIGKTISDDRAERQFLGHGFTLLLTDQRPERRLSSTPLV